MGQFGACLGFDRIFSREHKRCDYAQRENAQDHPEDVEVKVLAKGFLKPPVDHHLDPHQQEDRSESELEVMKLVDHACEGEVKATKTQNCEHVAREHEEWIARNGEDRRDGVDGEDEVCELHHHQRQKQRRRHERAGLCGVYHGPAVPCRPASPPRGMPPFLPAPRSALHENAP